MLFKSEEQSIVFFVFVFVLCRAIMLFGDERSLRSFRSSNVTQDEKDPEIFISSNTVFFSRVQKKKFNGIQEWIFFHQFQL